MSFRRVLLAYQAAQRKLDAEPEERSDCVVPGDACDDHGRCTMPESCERALRAREQQQT